MAGASLALGAVAAGLETDGVDAAVDFRDAEDLLDLLGRAALGQVDGFAAEAARLRQAVLVQVADDHDGGTQQLGAGRRGQAHGAGAGDVDGGSDADAGGDGAVEAGREDVREHGQVHDLLQGLVLVRELQQVPVGVGHQDVVGLAADPAAHVHVAVGAPGRSGLTFRQMPVLRSLQFRQRPQAMLKGTEQMSPTLMNSTSGPTSTTSPVISWPSTRSGGRRGAAADHVLVRAADVGGHGFQDDAVGHLAAHIGGVDPRAVLEFEGGVVNVDQFDFARPLVGNGFVPCHHFPPGFTDPQYECPVVIHEAC